MTRHLAFLQAPNSSQWLRFQDPDKVFSTDRLETVPALLQEVEQRVQKDGYYAVGCISYEASSAFDQALSTRPHDDFPLVWFGLYKKPKAILFPTPTEPDTPPKTRQFEWKPSISQIAYTEALRNVKEHIQKGNTYQVNYTFRLHSTFQEDPQMLFHQILKAQTTPYASYLDMGRFALCSVSPELFFHLDGEQLFTKPMKGTAPRTHSPKQDKEVALCLAHSEKNRAENVMIVDMIRNDMSRIALTGSVHVPHLFKVEAYPTVWQMVSHVHAKTQASFTEIIRALFPCASITGAPKARTMQIIAELEHTPRRIYTGCIGTLFPNRQVQFSVAIRTVLVDKKLQQAELGIGGGVVWDSTTEDEYQECLLKAQFLTQVLSTSSFSKPFCGNRTKATFC